MQHIETKAGIGGGLIMSLLSLNFTDLYQTVVYAAAGAVVSFIVPFILKKVVKMIRNDIRTGS